MSLEQGAAAVAVSAIVAYTIFGGADFGGGIWSALATRLRGAEQRRAIERAMGPVWETNHVWLILLVVTLFTAFPTAFAAIFTALYIPLFLAVVGIVARGAAFALYHYGDPEAGTSTAALRAFSIASGITPFVFGLCIGAVTDGQIELQGDRVTSGPFAAWLSPFALVCGVIGLLLCALLGAAYMIPRTTDLLQEDFRRRALASALALGIATAAAIPVAAFEAGEFASSLKDADVILVMAGTACLGSTTLVALARGAQRIVVPLAAATVTGVVIAWAVAANPYLIAAELRLEDAAAPASTLRAFLMTLPVGAAVLLPSLAFLYMTFSRDAVTDGD